MNDDRPSSSAQTVALCRAVLAAMHEVDDPLAAAMLDAPHRVMARALGVPPLTRLARSPTMTFLAARTLFFDASVNAALDVGVRQVVVVGAGYDSRAWRLARAGARFFEVDHPATQRAKRARAPDEGPTYVAADLVTDRLGDKLVDAGFDTSDPAVFVVEGLTMYLTEETVRTLLTDLAAISPTLSRLAINFTVRGGGSVSSVSRAIAWATRITWQARGEATHAWVRPGALNDLLLATGWTPREVLPAPDLAARYLTHTRLRLDGLNDGAICIAADRTVSA